MKKTVTLLSVLVYLNMLYHSIFAYNIATISKRDISDEGPAAKCQDIYERNKHSESGYYDIKIGDHIFKVYCYFHNPQATVIRQFNDIDGVPQEWYVDEPVDINGGDPEGAMEMQVEDHEIPPGAGPHFTQPIIDEQEKMYWNKTATIQNLIESNNERERQRKKQQANQQQKELQ